MATKKVASQPKVCSGCGRKSDSECARAECGNRKRITANVPDGSTHRGFDTGGTCRVSFIEREIGE